MSIHEHNRETLKKEIAALLDEIHKKRDAISSKRELSHEEFDQFLHAVAHLYRKTSVLHYLDTLPNEKVAPAIAETIVPPAEKKPELQIPVVEKKSSPVVPPAPKSNLKDIRSIISFNERLMFLRTLFGNDSAAYDEAINQVNDCTSWTEAATFLGVLKTEYGWNENDESFREFSETLKRRFS